ncbi:MAG: cyclic nucleotide-binding domain-containing protein [Burkholderiales bacterium]|nr:cyclic nucleotide-binding domain-containing protein [Burkholderiales bacterium]
MRADLPLVELARRLAATTMFSPLPKAQLLALLERSPRRRVRAGEWMDDSPEGLQHHVVLLAGELEARRCWQASDGSEHTHVRRVVLDADGPGFALVSAASRQLRVRAATDAEVLSIDSDDLDELLGWDFLGAFVLPESHLKVFHGLPLENVAQAINRLVERPVEAGETIVRQGEPGDRYYVILAGDAEVWERGPDGGEPVLVNRLSDGDSFGEEALLAGGERTATVTMTTPGQLLTLGKDDFDALLRPPMVEEIDARRAHALLARRAVQLLDCRHPAEHAEGHIPGARLLPLERLRHEGVYAIDVDDAYVVYCRNGRRSRAATFLLRERGIHAMSLAGGIAEWPYALEHGG